MMVQLSLLWIGLGMLVGLMACVARLNPVRLPLSANSPLQRIPVMVLAMLGGAVMALVGGWLGVLLVGHFFATAMALWVSIAGVLAGLWGMKHLNHTESAG